MYPLNLTFNGGRKRRSQIQNPSRTNGRAGRDKNKWIKKRATQIKFGITILTPQGSVRERNVEQKNSNSLGTYC